MAVGTQALSCYQGEDVVWDFTVSDPNVASIAGWTILLKIKDTPSKPDPPDLQATCTVTGTLTFRASLNINLSPGTWSYGIRRTNAGNSWELATGTLTVKDTPSTD